MVKLLTTFPKNIPCIWLVLEPCMYTAEIMKTDVTSQARSAYVAESGNVLRFLKKRCTLECLPNPSHQRWLLFLASVPAEEEGSLQTKVVTKKIN